MEYKKPSTSDVETTIFDIDDGDDASTIDADSQMEAIEASIESSLQELNDREKPKRLTMQLIRQSVCMAVKQSGRRLVMDEDESPEKQGDDGDDDADRENEIDSLLQKKVLRLDWMNIGKIENLEAFTHIQELYLQHNLLQQIENLDDHSELTFLALGGNRIQSVTNIKHLVNLKFLDLSNNAIDDFDIREFPLSLVILRLAGNPFTRHMPAYMHLFFERLPNLKQIDQYRRGAPLNLTDSPVGSPQSPMSFSPRSKISELDMEIEMSHKQDTPRAASLPTTEDNAETSTKDWPFDSGEYAKQKQARVTQWKQQLHVLETRKRELECDSIPMILRSTLLQSRRQKLLETARQTTKTAIADSIAHFQEMELQHHDWQERQHHAA